MLFFWWFSISHTDLVTSKKCVLSMGFSLRCNISVAFKLVSAMQLYSSQVFLLAPW